MNKERIKSLIKKINPQAVFWILVVAVSLLFSFKIANGPRLSWTPVDIICFLVIEFIAFTVCTPIVFVLMLLIYLVIGLIRSAIELIESAIKLIFPTKKTIEVKDDLFDYGKENAEKDLGDDWKIIIYENGWILKFSRFYHPIKSNGRWDMRYNGFFKHKEFTPEDVRSILVIYEQMRNDFLLLKNQVQTGDFEYKYYEGENVSIRYSRKMCTYRIGKFSEDEFICRNGELPECETVKKFRYAIENGDDLVYKHNTKKKLDTETTKSRQIKDKK